MARHMCLPATYGSVERLFSTSGIRNGDLRKRIKEETMELLLGVNKIDKWVEVIEIKCNQEYAFNDTNMRNGEWVSDKLPDTC